MKRSPLVFAIIMVVFAALAVAQQKAGSDTGPAKKTSPSAGAQASPEATDVDDPLFGIAPLPKGETSLIGGRVQKIDRIRNRLTLKPFGDSKKATFDFDERTHIYRDGVEVTERGIQRGDRVYVDSMEDNGRLFARNIRVITHLAPADARGQIMTYDAHTGMMTIRDDLSAQAVSFRVTQQTIVKGGGASAAMDLAPGSLVAVRFSPDQRDLGVAREVSVLAVPGTRFTFIGKVQHLDLRSGILVVDNRTDNKTYELQFQPGVVGDNVMVGTDVTVSALFNGEGYLAQSVSVNGQ